MHPIFTLPPPNMLALPGGYLPQEVPLLPLSEQVLLVEHQEGIFECQSLLTEKAVEALRALFLASPNKEAVDQLGQRVSPQSTVLGSLRSSIWSPELAQQLYALMAPFLKTRSFDAYSRSDSWQFGNYQYWQPIGLSPLLRFMEYLPGGSHYPHYDAAYFYEDKRYRSLMSVLIYLSTCKGSGATRLLDDGQEQLRACERIYVDSSNAASTDQCFLKMEPVAGNAFCFDHRHWHDALPSSEERLLIRTDLIYEGLD